MPLVSVDNSSGWHEEGNGSDIAEGQADRETVSLFLFLWPFNMLHDSLAQRRALSIAPWQPRASRSRVLFARVASSCRPGSVHQGAPRTESDRARQLPHLSMHEHASRRRQPTAELCGHLQNRG